MAASTDISIAGVLREKPKQVLPVAFALTIWRFMRRKPLGAVGLTIVTVLFLAAIFAPVIAPFGYDQQRIVNQFKDPNATNYLGTDDRGRDIFSRIVYGARVSIFVGFGVITTSMLISTLLGTISGYYGGAIDILTQRVVDIFLAIPFLILALTLTSVLPKADQARDLGPLSLDPAVQGALKIILALGIGLSFSSSRVIRSSVIAIKGNQYMESARALGASDGRILFRHILPNIFPTILVLASVQIGGAILAESSLSFLGFGINPPVPSWGGMLTDLRRFITQHPLLSVWPGLAIAITVFGFNMLGDALRDVLDPRLRGSR
ncbi:MAG: ABC transporter permease [Chloroflexi bacterium]|nr:ABC transporter permease [Chloroflexota bacterium]